MHGRLTSAVDFRHALQLNKGLVVRMAKGSHVHFPALTVSTTNAIPGLMSPVTTSVMLPSVDPIVTGMAKSWPFFKVQTRCCFLLVATSSPCLDAELGGPGSNAPTRLAEGFFSSCTGGVKRSAALGIKMAFSSFLTVMSAVAVIPGRRDRSELLTFNTVA